jgi:hypothetical protein
VAGYFAVAAIYDREAFSEKEYGAHSAPLQPESVAALLPGVCEPF